MRPTTIIAFLTSLAFCHGSGVHAQTNTAKPTAATAVRASSPGPSASASASDDIPMADYLGLLAQISPAAREGAQVYLQAFQQRCGRALTTMELRQAIAQAEGDPILMAMVRASHPSQQAQRDDTLRQLSQRIRCDGGRKP
jgi:hypothetical protein